MTEILKEGTHPLPYLQVGMYIRHHLEGVYRDAAEVWRVHCIYATEKGPVAQLRREERPFDKDLPTAYVKDEYELAQEFDPNR